MNFLRKQKSSNSFLLRRYKKSDTDQIPFMELVMNSRKPFTSLDRNLKNLDEANEYSTLADLMKEQGVSTDLADYWEQECKANPSNPKCLIYED